jgi:hypothetical protein
MQVLSEVAFQYSERGFRIRDDRRRVTSSELEEELGIYLGSDSELD